MPEAHTILTLWKAERRIEIGLGDEAEFSERDHLHDMVDDALDVLEGKRKSVVEPERFAIAKHLEVT